MFIPHSEIETKEILSQLGLSNLEDLFAHIGKELLSPPEDLPLPRSEEELREYFKTLSSMNTPLIVFAGAGSYDRIVPSALTYLIQRGELLTAYTPYQPEASQGTLQAIFEYQTVITELTGMEVANASMYDCGSALAEAVFMAKNIRGKGNTVVLSQGVNPLYARVVNTYLRGYADTIESVPLTEEGTSDLSCIESLLKNKDVYALCVQYPNFLGYIEPLKEIGELARSYEVPFITVADPVALALLKPPGAFGADIVVGEGQQLGTFMNFGGPYVGFFATREKFIRKMPGRLVGLAEDVEGRRAFTLVLQTREQHIRRERAVSNICTNQNLLAIANLIYIALLGKEGIKEVAKQSLSKALYLKRKLLEMGFSERFQGKHLWEFPLKVKGAGRLWRSLLKEGYLFGVPLNRFITDMEDVLLIAVTEKRTKLEMDELLQKVKEFVD